MWTLQGKRSEMYASIAAHAAETAVLIKTKPSRQLFLRLLEQTAVKEISISPGLWKTVPARVRSSLENVGVKVIVGGRRAGRPPKFGNDKKVEALELIKQKKTARFVSQQLGIPSTAIYFWKREQRAGKKKTKNNS